MEYLKEGNHVEYSADGWPNAWFSATVLESPSPTANPPTAVVKCHHMIVSETDKSPLIETVKASLIRPAQRKDPKRPIEPYEVVDVFNDDLWWTGHVVTRDEDVYIFAGEDPPDVLRVQRNKLRLHFDWDRGSHSWVKPPNHKKDKELLEFTPGTGIEYDVDAVKPSTSWRPAIYAGKHGVGDGSQLLALKYNFDGEIFWAPLSLIRPRPDPVNAEDFEAGQKVDAFDGESWTLGEISKVLKGKRYVVALTNDKKKEKFDHSQLRPHMDWINEQWVSSSPSKQNLKRCKSIANLSDEEPPKKKAVVRDNEESRTKGDAFKNGSESLKKRVSITNGGESPKKKAGFRDDEESSLKSVPFTKDGESLKKSVSNTNSGESPNKKAIVRDDGESRTKGDASTNGNKSLKKSVSIKNSDESSKKKDVVGNDVESRTKSVPLTKDDESLKKRVSITKGGESPKRKADVRDDRESLTKRSDAFTNGNESLKKRVFITNDGASPKKKAVVRGDAQSRTKSVPLTDDNESLKKSVSITKGIESPKNKAVVRDDQESQTKSVPFTNGGESLKKSVPIRIGDDSSVQIGAVVEDILPGPVVGNQPLCGDVGESQTNVKESGATTHSTLHFVKRSPIWEVIKGMEEFVRFPQNPNFSALPSDDKSEGVAIGHMVTFANMVDKISKLNQNDTWEGIQKLKNDVAEFEEYGFEVKEILDILEKWNDEKLECERLGKEFEEIEGIRQTREGELEKICIKQDVLMKEVEKMTNELEKIKEKKKSTIEELAKITEKRALVEKEAASRVKSAAQLVNFFR